MVARLLCKCLCIVVLTMPSLYLKSQNAPWVYGLKTYYGAFIDNHPFVPQTKAAKSIEFTAGKWLNGDKIWHQYYKFPEFGMSVGFHDLGNKDTLGEAITLAPYFRFGRKRKAISLTSKLGVGLAFFNKPYDALKNPGNLVIGSRMTWAVHLDLGLSYSVNDHLDIDFLAAFSHYSNAHFRVPNIGGNYMLGSIGARYRIGERDTAKFEAYKSPDFKLDYGVIFGLGMHEIEGTVYPTDGPSYNVYEAIGYVSRRINYRNRFTFSIHYNYYEAFRKEIVNQELFSDKLWRRSSKWIASLGHEFMVGHVGGYFNLGVNLAYPIKHKLVELGLGSDKFTHKFLSGSLGFNYYLFNLKDKLRYNPFVGVGLKSIGGKADYVRINCGMSF